MEEIGEKSPKIWGIYKPGPDPNSCPAWGFVHARWLIGLWLIILFSYLHYKYLSKNAKNKQALLFLLEIKYFKNNPHINRG